jgi:hypothetical protein
VHFHKRVTARLGNGDDVAAMTFMTFRHSFLIDLGNNDDDLVLQNVNVARRSVANGGRGIDLGGEYQTDNVIFRNFEDPEA